LYSLKCKINEFFSNPPTLYKNYFSWSDKKCYSSCSHTSFPFHNFDSNKCIENCAACEDLRTCKSCKDDFIYKEKKCIEPPKGIKTIKNCQQYDDNYQNCLKCKFGYGLNQTDKSICHDISEAFQNYYSKDNDITFYPCSSINVNCTKCYFDEKELRAKCIECKDDLVILNKANGQCKTKEEIIESPKYYLIDETHAGVCSKDIENCMSCDNVTYCTQCKLSYIFDNDLNKFFSCSSFFDLLFKLILEMLSAISFFSCSYFFPYKYNLVYGSI